MKIPASVLSLAHRAAAFAVTAIFAALAAHYPQYQPVLTPVAAVATAVIGGETLQQAVATHTDGKVAAATVLAHIPLQSATLGTVVKDAEAVAPLATELAPAAAAAVPALAKPATVVETIAQDIVSASAPVGAPLTLVTPAATAPTKPLTDNPQF